MLKICSSTSYEVYIRDPLALQACSRLRVGPDADSAGFAAQAGRRIIGGRGVMEGRVELAGVGVLPLVVPGVGGLDEEHLRGVQRTWLGEDLRRFRGVFCSVSCIPILSELSLCQDLACARASFRWYSGSLSPSMTAFFSVLEPSC